MKPADVVNLLIDARLKGQPTPVPDLVRSEMSPKEAYAIQDLHTEALIERFGGSRIGIKIGGADLATMKSQGYGGPGRGPILSTFSGKSGAILPRSAYFACLVEAEIAFEMKSDVGFGAGVPDMDGLADAVAAIIPCIEIADSRWQDFRNQPVAAVIADLGYAGSWISGNRKTDWRGIDLTKISVELTANGEKVREGTGGLLLKNPFETFYLTICDMDAVGLGLSAGEVVSAGTYVFPHSAAKGEEVVADFGNLGKVAVTFS